MSVILLWVTENIQTPLSGHLLPFSILEIKCFLGNGTISNLLWTEMKFSLHSYFCWVNYYNSFFPVLSLTTPTIGSALGQPALFFTRKEGAGGTIFSCCPTVDLLLPHSTTQN